MYDVRISSSGEMIWAAYLETYSLRYISADTNTRTATQDSLSPRTLIISRYTRLDDIFAIVQKLQLLSRRRLSSDAKFI